MTEIERFLSGQAVALPVLHDECGALRDERDALRKQVDQLLKEANRLQGQLVGLQLLVKDASERGSWYTNERLIVDAVEQILRGGA